jgi:hypothetical protein
MATRLSVTQGRVAAAAPWTWRIGAALATVIAGALLALVIAFWGWRWFGPKPAPSVIDKVAEPWAPQIVAAAPFGRAPPVAAAPAPAAAAAQGSALPAGAHLLGLFAGRDGDGYALFRLPDRGAILVQRGQEIVGDVKLEAVHRDRIEITERGQRRTMSLVKSGEGITLARPAAPAPMPAAIPPAPTPSAASKTAAVSPACARPPGFTGPVYRLNAELLQGMVVKPDSWSNLLAPADGALVVRDESGLAAMLGMKSGDRISQSNGIALASIDDMVTAVVRPLIASQPVHIRGARDGQPREWLFLNAGVCHS